MINYLFITFGLLSVFVNAEELESAKTIFNKGTLYYQGSYGYDLDYKKGCDLFERSADMGFAEAQYNLGYCYNLAQGRAEDKSKALELFRLAADNGHLKAKMSIATLIINNPSYGDPQEGVEILEDILKSDKCDSLCSYISTGSLGLGMLVVADQDFDEGVRLLKFSGELGHPVSLSVLEHLFQCGYKGISKSEVGSYREIFKRVSDGKYLIHEPYRDIESKYGSLLCKS